MESRGLRPTLLFRRRLGGQFFTDVRRALRTAIAAFGLGVWSVALVLGLLFSAIELKVNPLVVVGLAAVLVFFMLTAAQAISETSRLGRDPFDEPSRPTAWRLCDPRLSHWGVWRADLGQLPPQIAGFGDHRQVERYIHKLLEDWSQKSARGGRVVRISKPVSPKLSPFGDGPRGWKVYRIALEDSELRRTGWLRFGAGWAEFQLERNETERTTFQELFADAEISLKGDVRLADLDLKSLEGDLERSEAIAEAAANRNPAMGQDHPMWDRWLDA